jgi:hypothetical protein
MMILELVDVSYGFANPDEMLATITVVLETALRRILCFLTHHLSTSILGARPFDQPIF